MQSSCYQSGRMSNISHKKGADLINNSFEILKFYMSWIGTAAADNQFWFILFS